MATALSMVQVVVPTLGESVKQATLLKWRVNDGDYVKIDEPLCELETDKANVDVPAPAAGVIRRVAKDGDVVDVGGVIAEIDPSGAKTSAKSEKPAEPKKEIKPAATPAPAPQTSAARFSPPVLEDYSPAVRRLILENDLDPKKIAGTGPSGRLTKEDVESYLAGSNGDDAPASTAAPTPPPVAAPTAMEPVVAKKKDSSPAAPLQAAAPIAFDENGIYRAPMSKIRKRIAQTLVQAQHTAAILTTFNEVDLTAIGELRARYKERFQEVYGIGLGYMSFFARATVLALKEFPRVNAFIEGDDVIYHQFVHLGIAVSTDRGLAVPVLRNVEKMSFSRIEIEIKRLANATREGKLSLEELSGGTFTITNGGVFGSLLSTPILNPPQSGILGMHAIQKRAMVINDKVEVRSMMYVALSYDHRNVDGKESVSFLVRLKQYLEDPARLMLEI
ncbi:MAG: 2-oxoglutarate dehydrogenase complex dihydrolipoyllysine-residue succinyltransferase [Planctomycetota bacterium]|nr:2-oxoglutarate dehydrogenase complex dihydrolipoyllysine-residue succinyltransferase [Planctomycetota bacterium]